MAYILLIEDSPSDAALSLYALQKALALPNVILATTGQAALDLLGHDPLPMLIVLDLGLPDVDGSALLHQIRWNKRTGDIPVLILTGSEKDMSVLGIIGKGGLTWYIKKTANIEFLIEALQQIFTQTGC